MRRGILCSGNWVVDLIKIIDQWPKEGMLVNILSESMNGGGGPHNVLMNLAKMDPEIPLYASGLISNDKYGHYIEAELDRHTIDRGYLYRTSEESTSFTDVMMNASNGNRTFFHKRGTNSLLDLNHFSEINCDAKIFYLGYPMLLAALDSLDDQYGTKVAKLLATMKQKGFITALDLVSVDDLNYPEIVNAFLPYTDYLIINEIEAEKCSDVPTRVGGELSIEGLSNAAANILKLGVNSLVVIHAPEGGFVISNDGEEIFEPSQNLAPTEIKGSVGAGDAFCAGILYGLHQELVLKRCIEIANTNAWFNLQNETSTGGVVAIKDILKKIANL